MSPLPRKGALIILVGPAASGKSTLGSFLLKQFDGSLRLSISATTRAPRPGERNGVEYHFLSREEFERRAAAGEFFETEEVHGRLYGTLRASVADALSAGVDLLLDIDIKGAFTFKQALPGQAVIIFLVPPSPGVMLERLLGRGPISPDELRQRLGTAADEYAKLLSDARAETPLIDYVVVNDRREDTESTVAGIIRAERARLSRMDAAALDKVCVVPRAENSGGEG